MRSRRALAEYTAQMVAAVIDRRIVRQSLAVQTLLNHLGAEVVFVNRAQTNASPFMGVQVKKNLQSLHLLPVRQKKAYPVRISTDAKMARVDPPLETKLSLVGVSTTQDVDLTSLISVLAGNASVKRRTVSNLVKNATKCLQSPINAKIFSVLSHRKSVQKTLH